MQLQSWGLEAGGDVICYRMTDCRHAFSAIGQSDVFLFIRRRSSNSENDSDDESAEESLELQLQRGRAAARLTREIMQLLPEARSSIRQVTSLARSLQSVWSEVTP